MKIKNLFLVIALLLANAVQASPVTTDLIYAPDGLTIKPGNAVLSLPTNYINEAILTQSNNVSVTNKSFGQSSLVKKQAFGVYNFANSGGATSADIATGIVLPAKSIISNAYMDVITQPVSLAGSAATVMLSVNGAGELMSTTALSGIPVGVYALKQVGSTSTMYKTGSAATAIYFNIRGNGLSAGKVNFFVDYLISN